MKHIFLILSLLFPLASVAGVMNGGGGKGVLCRHQESKTVTLEVLDLYESKSIFKLQEEDRQPDFVAEWKMVAERMNRFFQEPGQPLREPQPIEEKKLLRDLQDMMSPIPPGTRLPMTEDATLPVLPLHCEMVQIAVYNDLGLQVDQEYWNLLDPRHQAALLLHEALYLSRRDYGATRSDETRKFVGRLFSKTPPLPKLAVGPNDAYYNCQAGGAGGAPIFDFVMAPSELGSEAWRVSFRQLAGIPPLSRVTADLALNVPVGEQFGASSPLSSEFFRETRFFTIVAKKQGADFKIQVSVYDSKTGLTTTEAAGTCRWIP